MLLYIFLCGSPNGGMLPEVSGPVSYAVSLSWLPSGIPSWDVTRFTSPMFTVLFVLPVSFMKSSAILDSRSFITSSICSGAIFGLFAFSLARKCPRYSPSLS